VSFDGTEKRAQPRRELGVARLWTEMRNVVAAELLLDATWQTRMESIPRSTLFAEVKETSTVGIIAAILVLAEMSRG
jgi:hypothetical protein